MKIIKNLAAFLFLTGILLIQSCNEVTDLDSTTEEHNPVSLVLTDDAVHMEDIAALYGGFNRITRGEMDIHCICDEANDTLLYVYNKPEGGWVIYSSDTRVPPIIAESESGSFSELMKNESAKC